MRRSWRSCIVDGKSWISEWSRPSSALRAPSPAGGRREHDTIKFPSPAGRRKEHDTIKFSSLAGRRKEHDTIKFSSPAGRRKEHDTIKFPFPAGRRKQHYTQFSSLLPSGEKVPEGRMRGFSRTDHQNMTFPLYL
jgi:hypothetical protein